MGKEEEIAHTKEFLLFPQCFLLDQKIASQFVNIFDTISLLAAELEKNKIGISGKGLTKINSKLLATNLLQFCQSPQNDSRFQEQTRKDSQFPAALQLKKENKDNHYLAVFFFFTVCFK